MADRPILFSAPMVRALLDGRKTQTRRIIKPQPTSDDIESIGDGVTIRDHASGRDIRVRFEIGDRLWVKETWQAGMSGDGPCVAYRADSHRYYPEFTGESEGAGPTFDYDAHPAKAWLRGYWIADVEAGGPWSTPLHMPRWASRLTLTVTDVRVQRLQDISDEDAIAEGLIKMPSTVHMSRWGVDDSKPETHRYNPGNAYAVLWNSINGAGSWAANPWVVAVSFDVRKGNIDG